MPTDGSGAPPGRARFDALPRESVVLRLVTINDKFLPNGPDDLPVGELFVPTRVDKEEAESRGAPVLVSVWEHGVTTQEEAAAVRRADAGAVGREAPVFVPRWFCTGDIEDAGTGGRGPESGGGPGGSGRGNPAGGRCGCSAAGEGRP